MSKLFNYLDNIGQSPKVEVAKSGDLTWWTSKMFSASMAAVWVQGLGLRVQKSRFRVQGSVVRSEIVGSKVSGSTINPQTGGLVVGCL